MGAVEKPSKALSGRAFGGASHASNTSPSYQYVQGVAVAESNAISFMGPNSLPMKRLRARLQLAQ
jgi:hypothetical protein